MVFSSLIFVFVFLPISIILYNLIDDKLKNLLLLSISLLFYAWGEPKYILLMIISIIFNYYIGEKISKENNKKKKKTIFIIGLVLNIGIIFYFKYFNMIMNIFIPGIEVNMNVSHIPVGISFYTFQTLSYLIDIYREKAKPQKNFILFALYITMFPQLIAGPIINYSDIEKQLYSRDVNFKKFDSGMKRFIKGLGKKVLLSNNLALIWKDIKLTPNDELTTLMAWIGILSFTLQIYFDFSGYSDMAIGLGKIFGFDFKENFNYPYISKSISEFWRRWHISLGNWFKEYIYIPLGGSKVGRLKLVRNMLIVWSLTGFWHGASWNFVFWGLYFGVLILLEKFFIGRFLENCPKIIKHIYTMFFVIIGWVFFEFLNLSEAILYLKAMFGMSNGGFVNNNTLQLLNNCKWIFIISLLYAIPLKNKLENLKLNSGFTNIYHFIIISISTIYMIASTYNPFIYFRF